MSSCAEIESDPRLPAQLDMLDAMAAVGVKLLAAIGQEADERAAPAVELTAAYDRLCRALRLNTLLQQKLSSDDAQRIVRARRAAEDERRAEVCKRKTTIGRIVLNTAANNHRQEKPSLWEGLRLEALDRLDDENLYGDILERPLSEIVALICEDLGLEPDWAHLSADLWAEQEIQSGEPGWPFSSPDAEALAGGEPLAERSEEPGVEGEGGVRRRYPILVANSS